MNIKPSESALVFRLLLVQFFLGLGTAFLNIASTSIFLHAYPPSSLSYVYLITAGILLGCNFFYAKLDAKLSSKKLLEWVLIFCMVTLFVFINLMVFAHAEWMALMMLCWNVVVYMLVGYGFWGLVSLLFDVRESRRVFGVVGAGDIPAKIIAYTTISILVKHVELEILLWFSFAFFIVGFWLIKTSFHKKVVDWAAFESEQQHHEPHHPGEKKKTIVERFFESRLIMAISILSLLAYFVFGLVDFTFLSEIKVRYKTEKELASFVSMFFIAGRLVAIVIKFIFSSRVMARLGLASTLLITPVLLLLVSSYIIFNSGTRFSYLYLFGIMTLLCEILRSAIQEPVFFVLFQPLNIHLRLKGHLIAKGFMLPPALIITGLFVLIYIKDTVAMAIPDIATIVAILLLAWIVVVFWVKKSYLASLQKVIQKGYFTGGELFLNDDATRTLLLQKINSSKPTDVIHTLDLLERSAYEKMDELLLEKLGASDEAVVKYTIQKVMDNRVAAAIPALQKMYNGDVSLPVRTLTVQALCMLDESFANHHLSIQEKDPLLLKAAILGTYKRQQEHSKVMALDTLKSLAFSKNKSDRILAANCIRQIASPHFTLLLEPLLIDKDTDVQKQSIAAAGACNDHHVLPILLSHLNNPELAISAQQALVHYGDKLFGAAFVSETISAMQNEGLMQVAASVKGDNADAFLLRLLKSGNTSPFKLTDILYRKKMVLTGDDKQLLETIIDSQLNLDKTKCQQALVLCHDERAGNLYNALVTELQMDLSMLLKACSLLYSSSQINRVIEIMNNPNRTKAANAIEMLEHIVPRQYFDRLHLVINFVADANTIGKNKTITKDSTQLKAITGSILQSKPGQYNSWTKAVSCLLISQINEPSLVALMQSTASASDERILKETRDFVISNAALLST